MKTIHYASNVTGIHMEEGDTQESVVAEFEGRLPKTAAASKIITKIVMLEHVSERMICQVFIANGLYSFFVGWNPALVQIEPSAWPARKLDELHTHVKNQITRMLPGLSKEDRERVTDSPSTNCCFFSLHLPQGSASLGLGNIAYALTSGMMGSVPVPLNITRVMRTSRIVGMPFTTFKEKVSEAVDLAEREDE